MDEFVAFIIDNWKVLLIVFITLLTFILQCLFKKAPVVKDDSAVFRCAQYIADAEKLFGNGNGDKKLQYVLDRLGDNQGQYVKLVEWLLSLPQKKG